MKDALYSTADVCNLTKGKTTMGYHAHNNIRRPAWQMQPSHFELVKDDNDERILVKRQFCTKQDFYNGFAWVMGNLIAWGGIGLAAYAIAKGMLQ